MRSKLISLSFKPSSTLPHLEDLKAFLETDLSRHLPRFTSLETNALWGECAVDLLGKDDAGTLIAVFPTVSKQERDYLDVMAQALLAATWLEENQDQIGRQYSGKGVNVKNPLKTVLVAPALTGRSRAVARTLEKAGVEIMEYSIYEIETNEGPLLAVTFDAKNAPASAPGPAAAPAPAAASRPAPAPAAAPPPPPAPAAAAPAPEPERPAAPPKPMSPVESFISSLSDPNLKAMSEQILTFLLSRFPTAAMVLNPQERGFTLNVSTEHLATIRLDKNSIWLEVGPEKIPTNKIKDPATLERAMNLPSVLEALQSVHAK
jgi:hypothetical protein